MSPEPVDLPPIGLGTAPSGDRPAADLEPALVAGLEAGFRLVDTAEIYGSEPLLGHLLSSGRFVRRDLVLVSKVWQTNHAHADVIEACRGSLRRLEAEELDLYLVHSPDAWRHVGPLEIAPGWSRPEIERRAVPRDRSGRVERAGVPLAETWAAMLELKRRGLARSVGVANCGVSELQELAAQGLEPPAVVQSEIHPLEPREELRDYCARAGIRIMAHSPLGGGRLLGHPDVIEVAAATGRTPAQAILAWHLAKGAVPIPGSRRADHLLEDLATLRLPLPSDAIERLDRLRADAPRRE